MKTSMMTMLTTSALSAPFMFTPAERAAGRMLRAPDHDASTGGEGDGSGNAGGSDGSSDAGAGDGGAAGGGGETGGANGGQSQDGGAGDAGAGGDGKGADGATVVGEAGGVAGEGGAGDEGGDGADEGGEQGEAPRLTFGEEDAAQPILGAPETYELVVPAALAEAGVEFDKDAFAAVEPVMRDLNLSQPAAQALVDAYAGKILPLFEERAKAAADTLGADMRRGWLAEAEKLFDGKENRPALTEQKAFVKRAFAAAGVKADSPFLKVMEESGLGNHPDIIQTLAFFGRNVAEAKVDQGQGGGEKMKLADRVYGQPVPREEAR